MWGSDPALFEGLESEADITTRVAELPSSHSPHFAPVIAPTLELGVAALVTAARGRLLSCTRATR